MKRPEIDLRSASVARIFDYYLGGAYNFAVDRALANAAAQLMPKLPHLVQLHRAFLTRAMRYLVDNGVTQFLDLGSGLLTAGSAGHIARRLNPSSRIVHVDVDPTVIAHSRHLPSLPDSALLQADLCEPDKVLNDPKTRALLDFDRPIGVLMAGVLDFVDYHVDLSEVMSSYRNGITSGSHLVLTQSTVDGGDEHYVKAQRLYRDYSIELFPRSRPEVTNLLAGFDLAGPGVVYAPQWHPDSVEDLDEHCECRAVYVAVGRRP